jgi:hypothetical protein
MTILTPPEFHVTSGRDVTTPDRPTDATDATDATDVVECRVGAARRRSNRCDTMIDG